MQSSAMKVCDCGHNAETHQHYRVGSDCGICGHSTCHRYPHRPVEWIRLHRWFRTEAAAEATPRADLRLVK